METVHPGKQDTTEHDEFDRRRVEERVDDIDRVRDNGELPVADAAGQL